MKTADTATVSPWIQHGLSVLITAAILLLLLKPTEQLFKIALHDPSFALKGSSAGAYAFFGALIIFPLTEKALAFGIRKKTS